MNIIYEKSDSAEIPRFISVICSIVGGPSFLITSFYGCPGKTSEEAKVFRRLYNHIYEISNKFGISVLILGGDFNQNLNDITNNNCEDKKTFHKIISDFLLTDAFSACPSQINEKDKIRLSRQDQTAYCSEQGFTYFPRIVGNKKSRLDTIFFSPFLPLISSMTFYTELKDPKTFSWNREQTLKRKKNKN